MVSLECFRMCFFDIIIKSMPCTCSISWHQHASMMTMCLDGNHNKACIQFNELHCLITIVPKVLPQLMCQQKWYKLKHFYIHCLNCVFSMSVTRKRWWNITEDINLRDIWYLMCHLLQLHQIWRLTFSNDLMIYQNLKISNWVIMRIFDVDLLWIRP